MALCVAVLTAGHAVARADSSAEPPDASCLAWLDAHAIHYSQSKPLKGVRTPIEVQGPLDGIRLVSRDHRPPLMDCELARALAEAAPVFADLGITDLVYSAAYDYRTRRDSARLSAHSNGLAIDVHSFVGPAQTLEVERDFETGVGNWQGMSTLTVSLEQCIGAPLTDVGRRLRTLACRLKLHPAFRVIVTRDDNEDHRDHFHLESWPDLESRAHRHAYARVTTPPVVSPSPIVSATSPKRARKHSHHKKAIAKSRRAHSR